MAAVSDFCAQAPEWLQQRGFQGTIFEYESH